MNNKDLLKIAEQFGTPTYVYDAESIKIQYEKLTSSFHKSTRFFYACKALSNINTDPIRLMMNFLLSIFLY